MADELMLVPAAAPTGDAVPAALPGLLLHKFVKRDSWRGALTADISGANLPSTGSAWIYERQVCVAPGDRRVGASSIQIAKAIADRGFFLFPISDDV